MHLERDPPISLPPTELRPESVRFHAHGKLAFAYGIMVAATNLHLVKTWRARRNARKADPNKLTRRERRRKARTPKVSDYKPDETGKLPDIRPPGDEPPDGPDPLGFLYQ